MVRVCAAQLEKKARWISVGICCLLMTASNSPAEVMAPIDGRFSAPTEEVPDFQKHVIPMMSKIGCNGRSCHGSFQGRGGFQLSLFGYDFKMDHEGLSDRLDTDAPEESYALLKALNQEEHEGGQKIVPDSWEHRVFLRWIQAGAEGAEKPSKLLRLDVTPNEIVAQGPEENRQLNVTAVWSDGTQEDVTPLCRFQSNDTSIAEVTADGMVTSKTAGDSHVVVFYDNGIYAVPVIQPVSQQVGANYPEVPAPTTVDKHVVNKLRKLGIVPSDLCSDEEFLRRVSLDIAGTLPTPQQVIEFVDSKDPEKRSRKIDELLETPAYAAWWATRFNDLTGNSANQLNNVTYDRNRVTKEWYEWVRIRFEQNMPYDEIVEGIVLAQSQRPDETYTEYSTRMTEATRDPSCEKFANMESMPYFWARRNFQSSEDRAIGFAYTFLGIRVQCAQCHKHPFDQWTQEDFVQFQPLFSRTRYSRSGTSNKEYQEMIASLDLDKKLRGNQLRRELGKLIKKGEVVPFPALVDTPPRNRSGKNKKAPEQTARVLGGEPFNLNDYDNPREPLMAWLNGDAQELFAKAFANRVWSNYFHRGIVEPTDDLNLANPPANEALLNHLTQGFIENDFDIKWLHREICNSRTYQLSWVPNKSNELDTRNFSRAVPRRMPAEVAIDAIAQVTGKSEQLESCLVNVEKRSIAIPGSAQGRNGNNYALTIFGKSARENNCDCERSGEPTLLQTLYLNNDNEVLGALDAKNAWLDELAKEWNVKSVAQVEQVSSKPKNYDEVIARYQAVVKRLKEQGNEEKLKSARARLSAYRKKYGQDDPQVDAGKSTDKVELAQLEEAVTDAYLRVLSRKPHDQEMEVSLNAVQSASNPLEGMRDLMWALLNTKEFIVNH